MDGTTARRMWQLLEPFHALVYFVPETRAAYKEAGLKGGWMGYFASRAAALGPASAELVIATFYNFHPAMVRRAIPDAWTFASPSDVLRARYGGVDAALVRLLGDEIGSDAMREAAALARAAAEACEPQGRPLFAAHAALLWPDAPHLVLWHAATLLREHRGDAHVAQLVVEDIDGLEAHVLLTAEGEVPAEMQRDFRGWSKEEWAEAEGGLRERGLLDGAKLSADGRALRVRIERRTDELALAPYLSLGAERCERLAEVMRGFDRTIIAAGGLPFPNPMGLPLA